MHCNNEIQSLKSVVQEINYPSQWSFSFCPPPQPHEVLHHTSLLIILAIESPLPPTMHDVSNLLEWLERLQTYYQTNYYWNFSAVTLKEEIMVVRSTSNWLLEKIKLWFLEKMAKSDTYSSMATYFIILMIFLLCFLVFPSEMLS